MQVIIRRAIENPWIWL